ncbi:MAG: IclR family transcriptional regulator [Rhodobacteraceae bacterium]|nr:IclR family transcriptional regulator [Paracoccaceae bacterium]
MIEIHTEKRKRGRPRSRTPDSSPVQALDRGLIILEALAQQPRISLSALARTVGMPPSTVHRILATLQSHGFADIEPHTQDWTIGIGAFRVGNTYLSRTNLVEAAQAGMRELTDETGETANLGIADEGYIVFISQTESQNPIRAMFRAGTRSPMHSSGIGKAMLAHMPRADVEAALNASGQTEFTDRTLTSPQALLADLEVIAGQGWSFDNEERYKGMRCIASAIFDNRGNAVAGVSVSGPAARFSDEMIARTGPLVQKVAAEITRLTGG